MIKELWRSFPRLLEQKINALLDEAEPTAAKAFQLYKTCQRENLWDGSFESFQKGLDRFFQTSKDHRSKGHMDAFLQRPMSAVTYEEFDLNFRNGHVNNMAVLDIASWAHHLMRVSTKSNSLVISEDVLTKALQYITHPPLFEKAKDILFEDFCAAWKGTVFKLFGKKLDSELNTIIKELEWFNSQLKMEGLVSHEHFVPSIYLTQTEIDWVSDVKRAVQYDETIPRFPLSRGAEKQRLMDLERTISLYKIVQTTKNPDFLKHKDNIRTTILDRCEGLLRECAR